VALHHVAAVLITIAEEAVLTPIVMLNPAIVLHNSNKLKHGNRTTLTTTWAIVTHVLRTKEEELND